MKILILEDEDCKYNEIHDEIIKVIQDADIQREKNWNGYIFAIGKEEFDLILLDLLVPRSERSCAIENYHSQLVEITRDHRSKALYTPAIVLTRHTENSEEFMSDWNKVNINVISFNDRGDWKEALKLKLLANQPQKKYEFVIVCALDKEREAFSGLTDKIGSLQTISGLLCQEVEVGKYKGVIVQAHRMGLVASAVVATMALERFEPRLICMSGICGGVPNESRIYDLLVSQTCHQHDAGKWSSDGFKAEHYDIQIDTDVYNKIAALCSGSTLKDSLLQGVNPSRSEFPDGVEEITCNIKHNASTSSGSAVIAEEGKTSTLTSGQRKLAGFEMEIYSIYEAAKHAANKPVFFAVKAVVDDGGINKGDKFHRIGCLLSAKFVVKAIQSGIADIRVEQSC